jgi:hypothetical protein
MFFKKTFFYIHASISHILSLKKIKIARTIFKQFVLLILGLIPRATRFNLKKSRNSGVANFATDCYVFFFSEK